MDTVELLLERDLEHRVLDVWEQLAARGEPSRRNHGHPTNRPHLTLAAVDSLTAAAKDELRGRLGGPDCPAVLDGLVRFSGRTHVLAWRVRRVPELLAVHAAVHDVLLATGCEPDHPLLRPETWQPHITLGRSRRPAWNVPDDQLLPPGLRDGPVHGRFTGARTYDSRTRTVTSLSPG
ncbi:2'-5' RNA ligase family protein [Streptomyces beigongshangae]|uniref:2'-5' RNA ligase family protein n=1 Tax=Streptomyces beigongshangae TaxID=2841597 RepID=UPI001C8546E3|nr:2'-5' RNA ligase family protein [Streptomyces sp. REN17]